MRVGKDIIQQFMLNELNQTNEIIQVSLFIVGKKATYFKKVDFSTVSPEKLEKWKVAKRLVTVIETSDTVYAQTNQKFTALLENQENLLINGKKVAVSALSEQEYAKLDEVFENFIQTEIDHEIKEKRSIEKKAQAQRELVKKQLEASMKNSRLKPSFLINWLISRMENIPNKIALQCLQRMNEAHREQEEQIQEQEKSQSIKRKEVNREILKKEIQTDNLKHEIAHKKAAKSA